MAGTPMDAVDQPRAMHTEMVDLDAAQQQLQALWIKYLGFLDQYSKAQQEISKYHSTGIFSLAEANFKNTTRTRYGQDYYDERMQAATRYSVADTASKSLKLERKESSQACMPPTNSSSKGKAVNGDEDSAGDSVAQEETEPSHGNDTVPDPIKWFGILVPPQLRACQREFLAMATGPVITAINASRSLREVEADIRRLRKDIRKAERAVTAQAST
ncbi:Hypothetical protein D9617_22g066140 [Elsinoe fawcettii]|nr:Hypothetical protein D9617_22g066140 [Elsinoe fawcettii]